MAGAGWRTFTSGAVLTAAQVQTFLQDQVVQVYASAAARSSALGTAVSAGMVSYRADGSIVEFYNGSAWAGIAPTSALTVSTVTAYTVVSGDANDTYSFTAASAVTVVVPDVTALIVQVPAPILRTVMAVPMGKAVVALVGIWKAIAVALFIISRTWY